MEKSAKLGKLTLLNIILFGFIGQVAWAVENNFFNTFLFSFGGTTKDISTMVAASAVVAVVTTFVMGTLSDKLGRRKVFICAGYVAWGITVMAFAFISRENLGKLIGADPSSAAALSATVTTVIVMDCIMTSAICCQQLPTLYSLPVKKASRTFGHFYDYAHFSDTKR